MKMENVDDIKMQFPGAKIPFWIIQLGNNLWKFSTNLQNFQNMFAQVFSNFGEVANGFIQFCSNVISLDFTKIHIRRDGVKNWGIINWIW